ncbi:hypothetical protein F5882DRAFT_437774 [Hyaloscypha sp. PMI_1271]|nr:hypothetical protein F5882DRAFT_437774 [Hyaloscypha sp. PMI_1271]
MKFGRIPKIYVPLDLPYAPGNSSFEDAEAIYVSHDRAREIMQLSHAELMGNFLQEERFILLDTIINEIMYYATGSFGKPAAPRYLRELGIYPLFEIFGDTYSASGFHEDNLGSVPVAYLQQGEGILMLPGNENLHAPFTLDRCLMKGVNYWDESVIGIIIYQIHAQLENPRCGNEGLPERTRELVEALLARAVKRQSDKYDEYVQIGVICRCV